MCVSCLPAAAFATDDPAQEETLVTQDASDETTTGEDTNTSTDSSSEDPSTDPSTDPTPDPEPEPVVENDPIITYRINPDSAGWQAYVANGKKAGKSSNGYKLEAFQLKLKKNGNTSTGTIKYRVNGTSGGWSKWVSAGSKATMGSDNTIEAIGFKLTGELAKKYTLYYCTRNKSFGWMPWAKASKSSGTFGMDSPMNAVRVKLVAKDAKAPADAGTFAYTSMSMPDISYSLKQSSKWKTAKSYGKTAGAASYSTKSSQLKAKFSDLPALASGKIEYRVRAKGKKWSAWKKNNNAIGSGKMQRIQMRITGDLADCFDIYYRTYCGDHQWLGWAKNGKTSGTSGNSYSVGGLEVQLVPKDKSAPGTTKHAYIKGKLNSRNIGMFHKAQSYSSSTDYLIMIDRDQCRFGLFEGYKNNWKLKYYWRCTVGKASTPTPLGTFTINYKTYVFGTDVYDCWYASQFYGGYLIHSIVYQKGSMSRVYSNGLGTWKSHGCVRLSLSNAHWVYSNVPNGTKIHIY